MPILYLVATPIGNLEDMTLRAIRVLKEVALVAAEDTRHSGRLLKHFAITTPLISFHEYSDDSKVAHLISRLATSDIALISDAGTPSISDPGYKLVGAAIAAGFTITPIPGANAATSALIASGLPTDRYLFLGFLPQKIKARRDALAEVASLPYTLVLYESPHRLVKLLADALFVLGDRELCVARELTKLYEELWRGGLRDASTYFTDNSKIRGEITVVIAGASTIQLQWDEDQIRNALTNLLASGLSRKQASSQLATQSGWRKKQIYNLDI